MDILIIKNILLILFLIILVYKIVSCKAIVIRTYTAETSLLLEESAIKIVLVSDLHSTTYGRNQIRLINKIKQQNPDLILLSGDIFDSVLPMTGTKPFLSGVSGIAPIYYVTGNHEYRGRKIQKIREQLEYYGVIILSDKYTEIEINKNKIILAGIEDPYKKLYEVPDYDQYKVMEEQFRELDEISKYKILLAHRPERIAQYQKFSFDLVLSGHTHGGQVRIPYILNGLIAPNQGLFPKYGGGLYNHNNSVQIISRGLDPRFPRIFNPPELVVVTIKSNL
ncbi:MAG: metallophosphoesterase [Treponema sp.]|jgi:predicted MPP superfamily phosphohydrolase|nr:metallophosphoesterase [Treponema sp.]